MWNIMSKITYYFPLLLITILLLITSMEGSSSNSEKRGSMKFERGKYAIKDIYQDTDFLFDEDALETYVGMTITKREGTFERTEQEGVQKITGGNFYSLMSCDHRNNVKDERACSRALYLFQTCSLKSARTQNKINKEMKKNPAILNKIETVIAESVFDVSGLMGSNMNMPKPEDIASSSAAMNVSTLGMDAPGNMPVHDDSTYYKGECRMIKTEIEHDYNTFWLMEKILFNQQVIICPTEEGKGMVISDMGNVWPYRGCYIYYTPLEMSPEPGEWKFVPKVVGCIRGLLPSQNGPSLADIRAAVSKWVRSLSSKIKKK